MRFYWSIVLLLLKSKCLFVLKKLGFVRCMCEIMLFCLWSSPMILRYSRCDICYAPDVLLYMLPCCVRIIEEFLVLKLFIVEFLSVTLPTSEELSLRHPLTT